ncbi:MAG: septum formation initiator family protein [Desulfobulbaceae bacterium]|nr:septum formation initiator family protein [Desulfobulbaceae bacterium]
MLLRFTMVLIAFCSLYLLFIPQHGLLQLILLDRRTDKLASELADLQSQNEELHREIIKIQSDKQYLEEIARTKYGLLKDNEIIYKVKP